MRRNESGRSMVEMLGVLAIVGVLSVMGIYGYTTAMRKHRINEILQTASSLAIISVSADGGSGGCVLLSRTHIAIPDGIRDMSADMSVGSIPTVNIQFENDVTDAASICDSLQTMPINGYAIDQCPPTVSCEDDED